MIPLSKDEQMALASAVDNLNEGQMEGLLQIVQERVSLDNPSAAASNGGEVELDIESMDTATLRELQRYISQCTGQAMPLQAKIYFANQNKAAAAASATATVAPPAKPAAPVPPAPGGVSIAERNLANLAKLEASSIPGPSASSVPGPSGPAIPDSGFIEGLGDDDEEEADAPPPPPPAM
jgi:Bromodomain extra-terminal - transcription regulation